MQIVDVGETWPVLTAWWNAEREDTEPSAITLTITPPTGATVTKTKVDMTSPDTPPAVQSRWEYPLAVTEVGVWRVQAVATVDGATVSQGFMFLAGDASLSGGPCSPWVTWADVEALCTDTTTSTALAALPNATREHVLDVATWVLYSLTGRRYPGVCETTRQVCRTCVTCRGTCGCGVRDEIDLSGGRFPVHGAWSVIVDGVTLDDSAYTVRGRRYLTRIDGQSWPSYADLTDPDAFQVSFAYGRVPPVGLRNAAAVFAFELAKKCAGGTLRCAIPERVTSITREGVTYTVIDSQRFLDEGRTGIYTVDLALAAAKAGRAEVRPGGYSPMGSR